MGRKPIKWIAYKSMPCVVCGKSTAMDVDAARLDRWQKGEAIQVAFSNKDADYRELLQTGTHAACWDKLLNVSEAEREVYG